VILNYDNILSHLEMLGDRVRTEAYQAAISEVVRPGDRVLDFGTGTGVLAIFAERAGAQRVFALDSSRMLSAARRLFKANRCTHIEPLAGDGARIELPEQVDVIVSEWMGHFLFAEHMFEPLLRLRDSFLRAGGQMIPARCSLHASVVTAPARYEALALLRSKPYGIDFAPISDWPYGTVGVTEFTADELLPEAVCLSELDMHTVSAMPRQMNGVLRCSSDAIGYGLCGWFEAQLSPAVRLSTSPLSARTHWKQFHFPFETPLPLRAGQPIEIELTILPHDQKHGYNWQARCAGEQRQGDSVLVEAWLAT
jgi:predicted nicotinamide N-methyase